MRLEPSFRLFPFRAIQTDSFFVVSAQLFDPFCPRLPKSPSLRKPKYPSSQFAVLKILADLLGFGGKITAIIAGGFELLLGCKK